MQAQVPDEVQEASYEGSEDGQEERKGFTLTREIQNSRFQPSKSRITGNFRSNLTCLEMYETSEKAHLDQQTGLR